eukprot:scaffold12057_cov133-Isochrysis_galbana.AAC.6
MAAGDMLLASLTDSPEGMRMASFKAFSAAYRTAASPEREAATARHSCTRCLAIMSLASARSDDAGQFHVKAPTMRASSRGMRLSEAVRGVGPRNGWSRAASAGMGRWEGAFVAGGAFVVGGAFAHPWRSLARLLRAGYRGRASVAAPSSRHCTQACDTRSSSAVANQHGRRPPLVPCPPPDLRIAMSSHRSAALRARAARRRLLP